MTLQPAITYHKDDFRKLEDGELIQVGDIVMDDDGKALFSVGPNHYEVGKPYEDGIMADILRRK